MPETAVATSVKFYVGLRVADRRRAVAFYRVLFGVEPAREVEDHVCFELEAPPLVLVLVQNPQEPGGTLNHLGLRVRANDLPELFAEAGRGLFAMIVSNPDDVATTTERRLEIAGHDIDFLLFDLHIPLRIFRPWPAFNVADSCICIAVVCFIIHSFKKPRPAGDLLDAGFGESVTPEEEAGGSEDILAPTRLLPLSQAGHGPFRQTKA